MLFASVFGARPESGDCATSGGAKYMPFECENLWGVILFGRVSRAIEPCLCHGRAPPALKCAVPAPAGATLCP